MPQNAFTLASSPHLRTDDSVGRIMWTVVAAMTPATGVAIAVFGPRAVAVIVACTLGCAVAEVLADRWRLGTWTLPADGSIVITGMLLALTLPPGFPLSQAFLGGIVASAVGKHVFGGLGSNIFNPALVGRAFLQAAFPVAITTWSTPALSTAGQWWSFSLDAMTTATPLAQMKFEHVAPAATDMLLGITGGSLGETSAIAITLGGLVLVWRRYVDWVVPVVMIAVVAIVAGILHAADPARYADAVSHMFAGGLMLGAWFMATDMVTSPLTRSGRAVFAFGAGLLVVIIRVWGGLPEGVMYSILLMNAVTPLINRWMMPRRFDEPSAASRAMRRLSTGTDPRRQVTP